MKRKAAHRPSIRNIWTYLRDYRFSSILLKYFLLLFLCLVLPITLVEMWFSRQQKAQVYEEIIKRNEASLAQGYSSVYSILKSSKNLSYSLSANEDIRYDRLLRAGCICTRETDAVRLQPCDGVRIRRAFDGTLSVRIAPGLRKMHRRSRLPGSCHPGPHHYGQQ